MKDTPDKNTQEQSQLLPKMPHPFVAIIPVVVLIGFLSVVITLFGSDSLNGGSQVALMMGMAVCVCISMGYTAFLGEGLSPRL